MSLPEDDGVEEEHDVTAKVDLTKSDDVSCVTPKSSKVEKRRRSSTQDSRDSSKKSRRDNSRKNSHERGKPRMTLTVETAEVFSTPERSKCIAPTKPQAFARAMREAELEEEADDISPKSQATSEDSPPNSNQVDQAAKTAEVREEKEETKAEEMLVDSSANLAEKPGEKEQETVEKNEERSGLKRQNTCDPVTPPHRKKSRHMPTSKDEKASGEAGVSKEVKESEPSSSAASKVQDVDITELANQRYQKYRKKKRKRRDARLDDIDAARMQNLAKIAQDRTVAGRIQRQVAEKSHKAFDKTRDGYKRSPDEVEVFFTANEDSPADTKSKSNSVTVTNDDTSTKKACTPDRPTVVTHPPARPKQVEQIKGKSKMSFRLADIGSCLSSFSEKIGKSESKPAPVATKTKAAERTAVAKTTKRPEQTTNKPATPDAVQKIVIDPTVGPILTLSPAALPKQASPQHSATSTLAKEDEPLLTDEQQNTATPLTPVAASSASIEAFVANPDVSKILESIPNLGKSLKSAVEGVRQTMSQDAVTSACEDMKEGDGEKQREGETGKDTEGSEDGHEEAKQTSDSSAAPRASTSAHDSSFVGMRNKIQLNFWYIPPRMPGRSKQYCISKRSPRKLRKGALNIPLDPGLGLCDPRLWLRNLNTHKQPQSEFKENLNPTTQQARDVTAKQTSAKASNGNTDLRRTVPSSQTATDAENDSLWNSASGGDVTSNEEQVDAALVVDLDGYDNILTQPSPRGESRDSM